jgi:hypothetical protein
MRTFTAAVGLIGILVSQAAKADETAPSGAPPSYESGGATTPPPAETSPPPAVAAPGGGGANGPRPFGAAAGPSGPSVWGVLPWGGIGAGARYMIPLPITQLLTRTKFRDYWSLEAGADILHFSYDDVFAGSQYSYSWTALVPVVGMMWQVWFTPNFAAYPKVEVGYEFGWYSGVNGQTGALSGGDRFYPSGAVGVLYKLDNGLTLRAEAGYDGAHGGIGWLF